MRKFKKSLVSSSFFLLGCFQLFSCREDPYAGIAQIPDFEYKTLNGETRRLSDAQSYGLRGRVFAFLSTQCPESNRYLGKLNEFHKVFRKKGIELVGVYPVQEERLNEVMAHAIDNKIAFPIVKDWEQDLALRLGAKMLSQVVLVSDDRKILYSGRIDDQFAVGRMREFPTTRELWSAAEMFLDFNPIFKSQPSASGCSISIKESKQRSEKRTLLGFYSDIEPIFQRSCLRCHVAGGSGLFSLENYMDVKKWEKSIRLSVLEEYMPPWHAISGEIPIKGGRQLSLKEKQLILDWIDQGLLEGNREKSNRSKKADQRNWEMNLGKPDFVFKAPVEQLPPSGKDYFKLTPFEISVPNDVYVRAVVVRPNNYRIVHHASLVSILPYRPGNLDDLERKEFQASYTPGMLPFVEFLGGFAQGLPPTIFPLQHAMVLPPKTKLVLSVHYVSDGSPQEDQTRVELFFSKKKPSRLVHSPVIANVNLKLEPSKRFQAVEGKYTFLKDSILYRIAPHAHYRASDFEIFIERGGEKKSLLRVPRYDSAFQWIYELENPLFVEKGSSLICRAQFDNSSANLRNPDSSKEVRHGLRPQDEMMFCFLNFSEK